MKPKLEVDASAVADAFKSKLFKIQQLVQSANVTTAQRIAADLRSRIIRPRNINVQDQTGRKNSTPVRTEIAKDFVKVTLNPHWTVVRSKAMFGLFGKAGADGELERTGLWVKPAKERSKSKGYQNTQGLQFLEFSSHSRLFEWANRRDRGWHRFRQSIFLGNPAVLKAMQMQPVLNRLLPQIPKEIDKGAKSI